MFFGYITLCLVCFESGVILAYFLTLRPLIMLKLSLFLRCSVFYLATFLSLLHRVTPTKLTNVRLQNSDPVRGPGPA